MRFSFSILSVIASAMAATVPSSAWTTLTPTAAAPSCAVTNYPSSFGIAISTITTEVNIKAKRDVISQIGDGQIQATTGTEKVSTVATTTSTTSSTTKKTSTSTTSTAKNTSTENTTTTVQNADYTITKDQTLYVTYSGSSAKASAATNPAVIVTQIGDGQIQIPNPTPIVQESFVVSSNSETTSTSTSYAPITSHSSFSYRSITSKSVSSASTTSSSSTASSAKSSASACATGSVAKEATCKSDSDLAMTLEDGILIDSAGRIGSIVSNRQFQFDGPPPQAGAIYAAGWSIDDGHLVIGDDYIFWECLSGTFYNLYDESIGDQCIPVVLSVIDLVDC